MTIDITYETEVALDLSYESIIRSVIEEAVEHEGCPYEPEIGVVLTDNASIRRLNREFRQIDRPTDVLSFPLVSYREPSDFSHVEEEPEDCFNPETGELMLGDIILSVEKVAEQAKAYGHSEERELAFLVAHSMLHLFGYDHMEDGERQVMEEKQSRILDRRGYVR